MSTPPSPTKGRRPPPCSTHRSHRRARTSGTTAGPRGARRGSPRKPVALPCTAQINRTTHQSRNLHLARSAERTRCIRTSYTRGFKGRSHKWQWSKVRSIETIESSIIGSCSVCMISPSSCTTISRLGRGITKLYRHIFYTTSRCIKSTHASIKRRVTACMHAL